MLLHESACLGPTARRDAVKCARQISVSWVVPCAPFQGATVCGFMSTTLWKYVIARTGQAWDRRDHFAKLAFESFRDMSQGVCRGATVASRELYYATGRGARTGRWSAIGVLTQSGATNFDAEIIQTEGRSVAKTSIGCSWRTVSLHEDRVLGADSTL